jgi:hypothetical protein
MHNGTFRSFTLQGVKSMNVKRAIVAGVVSAILFVVLEFIVHGVMLRNIYMETASIWRPMTEMSDLMYLMTIGQAIFGFFFAIIFAAGYNVNIPASGQGFRFGILMACLFAPFAALSWYVILPIPAILAVYWFVADAVLMLILGIVAGLIYKARR